MRASPSKTPTITATTKGPFWRPDAARRLRALIPELVLSIVAMTCLTAVMGYGDDTDLVANIMVVGAMQAFTQTLLYVCTYLVANTAIAYSAWFLVVIIHYVLAMIASLTGFPSAYDDVALGVMVGDTLGVWLFYLTRVRSAFVLLAMSVLYLSPEISQRTEVVAVHVIGAAALAALFVVRNSATHITIDAAALSRASDDADHARTIPGVWRQAVALAMTVAALCLAVSAVGTATLEQLSSAWGGTSTTGPSVEEEGDGPTPEEGIAGADVLPTDQDLGQTGAETGGHVPEGKPPTATDGTDSAHVGPRSATRWASSALALAPLLAAMPFLLRLLMRRRARRRIQGEAHPADCVAGIYTGIIARLEAAGIAREEAETPREFLARQAEELEELTASAGLGLDKWAALTDIHERARYAMLDPTPEELETCWKLYGALPACVRRSIGWPRYLADAFWRM